MGNRTLPHFKASATDSEGRFHIGTGSTEERAIGKLRESIEAREKFLASPPITQLQLMANQEKMYDDDIQRALRLIIAELASQKKTVSDLRHSYVVANGHGPGRIYGAR